MKFIVLFFTLSTLLSFGKLPGHDFRKEFGDDYTWAVMWLRNHDQELSKYARDFNIPANELKAIIFPELIRYNGLLNTLEIESLKYLYVSEGKEYADFSVGYFQMKPSFAERVELDGKKIIGSSLSQHVAWLAETGNKDNEEHRRSRVRRLACTTDQIIYLCMFYKICEAKYTHLKSISAEERVRFLATCYNAGYHHSYNSILSYQLRKHFNGYNYSAVSAFYFVNEKK